MSDEKKSTQQRIDALLQELATNGRYCEGLAGELPAVIAAIADGPHFELVAATFATFREVWKAHPDIERLFASVGLLIERDGVRRALCAGYEIGQLEKLSELGE